MHVVGVTLGSVQPFCGKMTLGSHGGSCGTSPNNNFRGPRATSLRVVAQNVRVHYLQLTATDFVGGTLP